MQFNTTFASSASTEAPATAATHNYFGAAINVDESKITQLPRAGPSRQPITSIKLTKIPGLLSPTKPVEPEAVVRATESDRFPSPEDSGNECNAFVDGETEPQVHEPWQVARSVAPSPAPSALSQVHEDIERLYGLEEEETQEIRALVKDVLSGAYKICLSTSGDLAEQYRVQIKELLGETVERTIVEDADELRKTGTLPARTPPWDLGYMEPRPSRAATEVSTPKRSTMPPPPSIPSRKRLREVDSDEEIREVENSLLLSRNVSVNTISSSVDSPAAKRPRLTSCEPTIDEREDNAMLGLIWGRYFNVPDGDPDDDEYSPDDDEYSPDDERVDDDESDSSSNMEAEEEDFSLAALTQGLSDDVVGFIEEAALYKANHLAEEAARNQSPNPSPDVDPFPIHSFGTAADRPPVPALRRIPQAPRRLHRSNERVTVDEDGSVEVFDYTQTSEYAERVAWERHMFVIHGQSGFDNRGGPCDLAADLREITQVGPGGELLDCHRWRYRFDEKAWPYFEVPS